ncbi:MAG: hypothetical protein MZU84_02815 [Sphingobacterium sp.]|nr:hypothetical protein [Sphingobacterium sp.]
MPDKLAQKVPALRHYRLIFESPENASVTPFPESTPATLPGIKQVKIFEFVRGAQIRGEGIIEVPVVTNTAGICISRRAREDCLPSPIQQWEIPMKFVRRDNTILLDQPILQRFRK